MTLMGVQTLRLKAALIAVRYFERKFSEFRSFFQCMPAMLSVTVVPCAHKLFYTLVGE